MLRLCLLLFCTFAGQCLFAQDAGKTPKSKLRLGLRAGLNGSNTSAGFGSGSPLFKDPSMKLGMMAGITLQAPLGGDFYLQPELLYSREGSLQEGIIGNVSDANYVLIYTTKLNFINVPVLLQYNKGKGFYAETGPQAGFLMSAQRRQEFPTPATTTDISKTNGVTLSWVGGVGYTFASGWGAGLRYTAGLTNFYEGVNKQRVNTLQLHLHYRLGGK